LSGRAGYHLLWLPILQKG